MISCVFGPPGSGKTTLLREFQSNNSVCPYLNVDFARRDGNAFDILKDATGLDFVNQHVIKNSPVHQAMSANKHICVIIVNAHVQYHNEQFWLMFVKYRGFLTGTVRFIVSASCSFRCMGIGMNANLSDYEIGSSLLLDATAARAVLDQAYPLGLREDLKNKNTMSVIVDSCAGNLTALRTSIDLLHKRFQNYNDPSFSDVLLYYLSKDAAREFHTCFGTLPHRAELLPHSELLGKFRLGMFFVSEQDFKKMPTVQALLHGGILVSPYYDIYECASPLAVRYLNLTLPVDEGSDKTNAAGNGD